MKTWNSTELNREEIREKKRNALVKQAALEFRKRGYHGASMTDIAKALGVTKGALYRYVKTKDEVLFECFKESNAIARNTLKNIEKMNKDTLAIDKLAIFMQEFIEQYLDNNLAGIAMVELNALLPNQRKIIVKGRDKVELQLTKIILDGVKDGSVAEENPKFMIFTFMGAINWIPSWYNPKGEYNSKEVAEYITNILLNGIRNRG